MKISIITPSYNSGQYIERAIQSVLSQDYDNWEHIIVDGGSTDGTLEILKKYPHLKWVSEQDKGQSDAMNKGFQMSTGDIIGYLNADDMYYNTVFGQVITQFDINKEIDFIVGNLNIQYKNHPKYGDLLLLDSPQIEVDKIIFPNIFRFPANPVSYFYKRKVQRSYGDFPVNNHYTMDYHFLLYALKFYRAAKVNMTFGIFAMDGENKTSQKSNIPSLCEMEARRFVWKYERGKYLKYWLNHIWFKYAKPTYKKVRLNLGLFRRRIW